MAVRVGIDIGGTFTDIVVIDDVTGRVEQGKVPTTYPDPSQGVIRGLQDVLQLCSVSPMEVGGIVHGTTLVANAVIQRQGAKTALLTTKGYRDILEIGRELKYDLYDLQQDRAEPLVPRFWRREVNERVSPDGAVVHPLRLEELPPVARELALGGVESIAVALIHAYAHPSHEQQVRAWLGEHYPDWSVSISSETAPEVREYERMSTTAANAYVQPIVGRYLERLEHEFRELGFGGSFHLMLSSGGIGSRDTARKLPIWLIESGAAAGAMAAAFYAQAASIPAALSFDMGGTTAKICLIDDGQPARTMEIESARIARFSRYSGIPLRLPALELIEIGAGGGSIASADSMGLLRVGPLSAGAEPGPACYHAGGDRPTVTDADLLLGYLNPAYFLGGLMQLDKDAAAEAVKTHVGDRLGLSVTEAAIGINEVVNENMTAAMRMHVIEKGRDPRQYSLIVFGGAGPVHGYEIARRLHLPRVVYPLNAGVASAMGLLVAPFSIDLVGTRLSALDAVDWSAVEELFSRFQAQAEETLTAAGAEPATIETYRSADMRYAGQGREVSVALLDRGSAVGMTEAVREAFYQAYTDLYGRHLTNVPVEAVNWRLHAVAPPGPFRLKPQEATGSGSLVAKGAREVYFPELGTFVECPVYEGVQSTPGTEVAGPAIVEQLGSTIVIGPSGRGAVDPYLSLVVELSHG